jgi:hypothetical protein
MRLTCLRCGHQIELATGSSPVRISCVCGKDYSYPDVHNMGTRPNERAAERSRYKAFRAAGLVKNVGGFALGISLLGVLFFPIAIAGAAVGIYVLTMVRGPIGKYSGRKQAVVAVVVGVLVFVLEGALALSWLKTRHLEHLQALQSTAPEDLRALLRAERLYRATTDSYGTFSEFQFEPRYGLYTIYLGADDYVAAHRDGKRVIDPLPAGFSPGVSETSFTAVAVANLDNDPKIDVWVLNDHGEVVHARNDVEHVEEKNAAPEPEEVSAPPSPAPDPATPQGP